MDFVYHNHNVNYGGMGIATASRVEFNKWVYVIYYKFHSIFSRIYFKPNYQKIITSPL